MKVLYYDCFSGISGAMNLGALIDIGVEKEFLLKEISKLGIDGYDIKIYREIKNGISGTKVDVLIKENQENCDRHRNLSSILNIINSSSLKENVKKTSRDIFMKIAKAEGKIHEKPIDCVHFHEVGVTHSIINIVGAAICLDFLQVDKVIASSIEVGRGLVKCQYGTFPVPTPSTIEILKGTPIKSVAVPFEATTPTGAAILAVTADEFTDNINLKTLAIGYGIGNKDGELPNVLRVIIGESQELDTINFLKEEAVVIECNIDDMNPELYEVIIGNIFKIGAMDVHVVPIIMKKGRPAVKLSVLCNENISSMVEKILFTETTTFGVRKYKTEKTMLKRRFITVNTIYGDINIKVGSFKNRDIKYKAEFEDCKRAAQRHQVPITAVYEEIKNKVTIAVPTTKDDE